MSCARTGRRRPSGPAPGRYRRPRLQLTFLLLIAAGTEWATSAAAQLATGLPPPGGAATSTAPGTTAPPTGVVPNLLPPPPVGPIGLPSPLASPNTLPYGLPTPQAPPVSPLGLAAPGYGLEPLQLYNPNAPAILFQPFASVGERLTDNVFYTHSPRTAAAETMLSPGISISADTPRFQGVLTGSATGDLYVPSNSLNQIVGNLYGRGTGTILPGRLFVDLNTLVTQGTTVPGLGFVSPSQLPSNAQTQVFVNTVSPYLRESIDGMVDSELRYTLGSSNFGGNTRSGTPSIFSTNLGTGVLNEGTFTAATGRDIERALSRLTVDASNFNSPSASRNTQFSGYDDLEYRIRPNIAALARVGYQNIRYPFAPAATFAGATWLIGGRIGLGGNYGYASLEYGRQQGVYGFTGSANYQITPTLTFVASLVQGISSPSQYLQTALDTSTLSPNGGIVDEYSGLPTAFYSPGLGLTTNVYREHLFNASLTDQIGINSYTLYGYYTDQQSLTPPVTAPTKSAGANFTWSRDIRPDLNGNASLGYTRTTNAFSINTGTPISAINTLTAYIGINYLFARSLTGSLLYSFSYQPNGGFVTSGRTGDVVVNSLQLTFTKSF